MVTSAMRRSRWPYVSPRQRIAVTGAKKGLLCPRTFFAMSHDTNTATPICARAPIATAAGPPRVRGAERTPASLTLAGRAQHEVGLLPGAGRRVHGILLRGPALPVRCVDVPVAAERATLPHGIRRLDPDPHGRVRERGRDERAAALEHEVATRGDVDGAAGPRPHPVPPLVGRTLAAGERREHLLGDEGDPGREPVPAGEDVVEVHDRAPEGVGHRRAEHRLARAAAARRWRRPPSCRPRARHPPPPRARRRRGPGRARRQAATGGWRMAATLVLATLGAMSVAVRVIPCLDVDAGRVVKGVNFVDLRDAGDPVELARRYDAAGRRRADLPRRHRLSGDRETTLRRRARAPPSRSSSRSPSAAACAPSTTSTGCCGPGADKVGVNTAAIARPELIAEIGRPVRRPGARAVGRRPALPAATTATAVRLRGDHPRRAPRHRHRRRRVGRARRPSWARGRSCSTRWTPTAPRTASTSR